VCTKIFIAATGKDCGKTTTSLSLLHLARQKYKRVGFIKPLGPKPTTYRGRAVDMDAALLAEVYGLGDDIEYLSPVVLHSGDTQRVLDGYIPPQILKHKIIEAVKELDKRCDFLIIEGAGHSGVGSVLGLGNATIARMVDAPVLMVSGGGIGNAIDTVTMNLALFQQHQADVRLIMANKLLPEKREKTLSYLERAFGGTGLALAGGFNYSPLLANPTLQDLADLLKEPLKGDRSDASRIAHHIQLGAPSAQRVADLLQPDSVLIVTSTRDELLVMLASLYQIPEYRNKIAGLVVTGKCPVSNITQKILDRSNIPYVRAHKSTADVFQATKDHVSKISPRDHEKIQFIQKAAEKDLDFDAIDSLFSRHKPQPWKNLYPINQERGAA